MKYIHKKLWLESQEDREWFHYIKDISSKEAFPIERLLAFWFEEEKNNRPEKWEDLIEISWYHINNLSWIKQTSWNTKAIKVWDIFLTREQAEWALALAQITQLLWPNWYDVPEGAKIWYDIKWVRYWFPSQILPRIKILSFDTEEKRDHFVKHHQDLIYKVKVFYII